MLNCLILTQMLAYAPPEPAEVYETICTQFASPRKGYFRESVGGDSNPNTIMYNWGLGVVLSAENALAQLDKKRIPRLKETMKMVESYWNPNGPVAGFDVNPGPPYPNDRYYDDNAWMVMALVETYELTHDPRALELAEKSLVYCLSGLDDKLGGGIYWKETDKASKNTCSNGPTAAACLALYKHTKDPKLIKTAEEIYAWTKKTLQDPDSKLYWDNINLDGKVEKTTWSYNSALMLRAARGLAQTTGKAEYKKDTEELQAASMKKWLKPHGVIDDEVQFAHLLFENLDPAVFDHQAYAKTLLESRSPEGLFGHRWGLKAGEKNLMLHQASAVRALAIAKLWSKKD